ncbi:hypothetical protein AYJ57_22085 (plasmid) [Salipiger sp. CCB-MM3]|uniref:hypothetical protein n=1 Tax=Salipiger sp. CCB-MM3 TaxID=1792508 RepID=UPI00080A9B3F|nr:hypothetical protein [Salipiger sp. CCB-MM3]ANT63176.1 hypothetical protein AYJ57_22085 [Salipiger sp. CCB-MM3]
MALLLCACPVLAERGGPEQVAQFTHALLAEPRVIDPPALYLGQRAEQPFLEERARLMDAVIAAGDSQPEQARALTDLAEFFFAHAMSPEGLSVLQAVEGEGVPPAHELRARSFELALGLIDPRGRPLTQRAATLLDPAHSGWPDQPLFLAISHIRDAACAEAGPLLPDAVTRLSRFPKPVQARVLPGFLDCAIETGQWRLARDIAAAFEGYPELKGGTAYHFLLGKVAESADQPLAAFDSYTQAIEGQDIWAHRARRALITLGLTKDALATTEAIRLLKLETEMWRGDASEGDTLDQLASLQVIAGRATDAIESYGLIVTRRPGSAQATAAQQKARALIEELYRKGAEGEIPLGRFMADHARIARYFRFTQNFALASELFADTFRKAGATKIAAEEYATTHDYLTAAQDLGITTADEGQLSRLKVKEAETLLAGGQFEALGTLLLQPITLTDPDLKTRFDLVSARYFDETGQTAELLDSSGGAGETTQILRLQALAHFERKDWPAAAAAYETLHVREGKEMPLPDAIRLLLSEHRSGAADRAAALASEFPSLTELPGWAEIARGLTTDAPALLPLREDTARARIDKAQETLDVLPDVNKLN